MTFFVANSTLYGETRIVLDEINLTADGLVDYTSHGCFADEEELLWFCEQYLPTIYEKMEATSMTYGRWEK